MKTLQDYINLADEIVPIKGFPDYLITKEGKVISCKGWNGWDSRELVSQVNESGYEYVRLSRDGKRIKKRIHTLVAENFLPKPENSDCVCHWDGNKRNNKASNLRWGTPKDNADDRKRHGNTRIGQDNGWAKLTPEQAYKIKKDPRSAREICTEFDISKSTVWAIKDGRLWKEAIVQYEELLNGK